MKWSGESVWFSLFPRPEATVDVYLLFRDAVGLDPDVVQPLEGIPPGKRASKQTSDEQVSLIVRHGRIDVVIEPVAGPDGPPQLRDLDQAIEKGEAIARAILGQHDVLRISCIVNMMQLFPDAPSSVAAFNALREAPPVDLSAQDVIFQRNLLGTVAAGNSINRIIKWATSVVQFFQLTVTPGTPPIPQIGKQWFQLTKMLDYNTVPNGQMFAKDAAVLVLGGLVDEVRSTISQDGD